MSEEMVKRRMALGSKFKAGLDAGSVLVSNEFFGGMKGVRSSQQVHDFRLIYRKARFM